MGDYWVFGNYESQLNDDWLSTESEYIKRKTLARTRRLSMSSLASASPISVPSASPLLSASQSSQSPSGQSSPTNASQDSAVEISDAVSKIFRKDKGFKGRFDKWKSQSLTTSFNRQDTDLVITQRLCVFFHVEITGYLWSQASRVAAYELQDENLAIQHQYLVSDYAAIFSGHQYPRYIGDVSTCQQLVQDAERQSLVQRRMHLSRIIAGLKSSYTQIYDRFVVAMSRARLGFYIVMIIA